MMRWQLRALLYPSRFRRRWRYVTDEMQIDWSGKRHRRAVQPRSTFMTIRRAALVSVFSTAALVGTAPNALASGVGQVPAAMRTPTPGSLLRCPWVGESRHHQASPASLAGDVLARMSLLEKAGFVTLRHGGGVENFNRGVPSLCIPALTLADGPDGVAGQVRGVTRLPAAIGVAASFNPAMALATGKVLGAEARTKGLDVVQGPELN